MNRCLELCIVFSCHSTLANKYNKPICYSVQLEFGLLLFVLGKGSKKIKKNGWINPSGLAGCGQPRSKIQQKK